MRQDPKTFTVTIDQHLYVKTIERVFIPKARRLQPKAKLTPDELHSYRSLVGQLAWPARESMPQLSYAVSDLQQKTQIATVHDLCHANNILALAKRWAELDKQQLVFRPFNGDVSVNCVVKELDKSSRKKKQIERKQAIGLGAVHDAAFMQQPQEGSQAGYLIMLAPVGLYDGPVVTHLLDWNLSLIHI